jgi:hypothetical protein
MRTELVTAALQMALTSRRPHRVSFSTRTAVVNTPVRRTAKSWTDMARQSIGRPGTCWDNAVAESFFATLKELIYPHVWPTRRSARAAIFSFIEGWYNGGAPPFDTQLLQPNHVRGALLSTERSRMMVFTNPSVKAGQHQARACAVGGRGRLAESASDANISPCPPATSYSQIIRNG